MTTTPTRTTGDELAPDGGQADGEDLAGTRSAWLLVARREILVRATDRSFLIGTLATVAILGVLIAFQAFMAGRTHSYTVVAEPSSQSMARAVEQGAPGTDDQVRVTLRQVPDAAAARSAVLDGSADAWLHPVDGGWVLTTRSQSQDSLRAVAAEIVRTEALRANATALGTTVESLQRGATLQEAFLEGDADRATLVEIVGFAFVMLFYLANLVFGMTLATSVVEEKQSRIVEIIATAIPIRHLLAGKVLGNTVLAVAQLTLYIGVGLVGLAFTKYSGLTTAMSGPVLWFVVFFLAGFVALACLWAVAGALASRNEDVQATSTPLTMVTFAVFLGGIALEGTGQVIGSYVPPLSAVLMPIRLLRGDAAWWEALLALALLLATTVITVIVGERLYRRSLLQTGGRIGWRHAWRAAE
jgi:ABC-2 type transport system permease protein